MRYMFTILFSVCVFAFGANAQNSGIQFEQDTAWKHVLKKARKVDKLVFVDCYTSWCGPCKILSQKVFTNDTVGTFFNEHFINSKFDMEKDSCGVMLRKKYQISAFPTLLFIDPKTEEVVHKVVGACDVKLMVEEGEQAINPQENLRALRGRFATGDRSLDFLKGYLFTAMYAREKEDQEQAMKAFVEILPIKDWKEQMNWHMICNAPLEPLSAPVKHVMDSLDYAYKIVGKEKVDEMLYWVFYNATYKIATWKPQKGEAFDEVSNDSLVNYLLRFDHASAPAKLAYLYTAERMRMGDYRGMLSDMREAFRYNVFRGTDGNTYFHVFMEQLTKCTEPDILQEGIEWIDEVFAKESDLILKGNLMKRKGNLLKAKGDSAAADKAFEFEKKYMSEGLKGSLPVH